MKNILMVLFLLITINCSFAEEVEIEIDEKVVDFTEEFGIPFIDGNSRTQVPLRTAMESFGAEVSWNAETREAIVLYESNEIRVPIGEMFIFVNNNKVYNDTSSVIVNGRTYLPIRVVLESLGAKVSWNATEKKVVVISKHLVDYKIGNKLDDLAFDFKLDDQNNNTFTLSQNKGKKVILSFFTTY